MFPAKLLSANIMRLINALQNILVLQVVMQIIPVKQNVQALNVSQLVIAGKIRISKLGRMHEASALVKRRMDGLQY